MQSCNRTRDWFGAARWRAHREGGGPFGGHKGGPFGGGPFGRHRGGPFGGRRGPRMFEQGALRLVALGLIADAPRHGYDIIRALEERFAGAYSPSPGAIYPMLQMLEEADLVVSEATGNKRLFSITDAGRAYLAENAAELSRINSQMDEASDKAGAMALGAEMRALGHALFSRLRGGTLSAEQAETARAALSDARRVVEGL